MAQTRTPKTLLDASLVDTSAAQALTNKDLSGGNTFPTFNQNTTGSAATLTTARAIQTNLASTSSASFNGSAAISPGVTGTLPASNGGTSQSTYAAGDLLYASAVNTLSKLPVGTNGQVLTLAGGLPSWAAGGSGGGSATKFSQNYTAEQLYNSNALQVAGNGIATRPVSNGATIWFTGHLPPSYAGGGITIDIYWAVDNDNDPNRTIQWSTSIMRVQTGTDALNSDSYATSANTASVTSGAAQRWQKSTVAFTSGAAMDSAIAGESIRVRAVLSYTGGGSVLVTNATLRET